MKFSDKTNKILNLVVKILTGIVIAITVLVMVFTIFATTTFDKNNRNLFGCKFYIVKTDSMSKSENNVNEKIHFNAGDIIIAKKVKDKTKLKVGDVISFQSLNEESFGETITHQIKDIKYDDNGKVIGYVTFGTNTGATDKAVVEPEYVMGKYVGKLPKLGYFFSFLKTTPGYIICILIPFLILIIYQGVNCIIIFRKYKKQQLAEINEEKAKIEEERKASADMLKELQELKAKLAMQSFKQSEKVSEEPKEQAELEIVDEKTSEDISEDLVEKSTKETNSQSKNETTQNSNDAKDNEAVTKKTRTRKAKTTASLDENTSENVEKSSKKTTTKAKVSDGDSEQPKKTTRKTTSSSNSNKTTKAKSSTAGNKKTISSANRKSSGTTRK